jgi:hypothetical protein
VPRKIIPWFRHVLMTACAVAFALSSGTAFAEPTHIVVRVLSKDAKFVGTPTGGARITIRDADTGELLADGVTTGGTGDTRRLMNEPHARGQALSTPDAARFETTLDLDAPRRLQIEAFGPLAQRQSANRASVTTWVVPGKSLDQNDGVLLELPGFAVDVLDPPVHSRRKGLPAVFPLRANVVMMCGCPVQPDGLWDANRYQVKALLRRDGQPAGEVELHYAGTVSQFEAQLTVREAGTWQATVYAYDPSTGNTGVDTTTFVVE